MSSAKTSVLSAALDRLWIQFLPQMTERVSTLEAACTALSAGALSVEQRTEANAAAHKLAGGLGTFGLTKGTELAREAEVIYSGEPDADPDAVTRLTAIAAQLRAIVASKK